MNRRERGAAVSVMWVIFLIVLLLGATAYIYFVQSEIQSARNAAREAERNRAAMEEELVAERQKHAELSSLVGFVDVAAGDQFSSLEAIQARIEELRGRYPEDIGAGDKTLEDLITRLTGAVDRHAQAAAQCQADLQSEVAKRQEAEAAKDQIRSQFEQQLAQCQSELRDERDRAQAQIQEAEQRIAQLQDQLDEAAAQVRERQSEFEAKLAALEQEKVKVEARVTELAQKVKLIGITDDPWAPDGEVVEVGGDTGLVYLDIGARDLLRLGVRFDVFRRDKGGRLVRKGLVEVREVDADSSMAMIVEEVDPLDPIAPGDVVANPHFSRYRSKVFALLGTFPTYGRDFIVDRLRALGAEIEPKVTPRCDFVLLGQKAPEEDAPELTELPGFKLAQELEIQMLRLADVERFIRP